MKRASWDDWQTAPTAAKFAALVASNEALVQKVTASLVQRLTYVTPSMREDVLQGVRIGLIRAIRDWDPTRAKFSPFAWGWMRYEGQLVLRHIMPVSYPRDLIFCSPERETEAFYAKHGRDPAPSEVSTDQFLLARRARARSEFVSVPEAENIVSEESDIEADIDRQRDMKSLKAFLAKLSKADQKRFWTGKDEKLTARAKVFVEGRRILR